MKPKHYSIEDKTHELQAIIVRKNTSHMFYDPRANAMTPTLKYHMFFKSVAEAREYIKENLNSKKYKVLYHFVLTINGTNTLSFKSTNYLCTQHWGVHLNREYTIILPRLLFVIYNKNLINRYVGSMDDTGYIRSATSESLFMSLGAARNYMLDHQDKYDFETFGIHPCIIENVPEPKMGLVTGPTPPEWKAIEQEIALMNLHLHEELNK
jgi:hypothetical protein